MLFCSCVFGGLKLDNCEKVTNDCMFVDTDSITGFHQRFTTYQLRDRFIVYFRRLFIVSSIEF